MRLILVAGTTATATVDGLSAAGADPDTMAHTPSADAEILAYGDVVRSPVVPVSPTGCPTPAVVTRAARDLLEFPVTVVDGGLARPTAAPTVEVGAAPGGDVRDPEPVPDAGGTYDAAVGLGRSLPEAELLVAETVPGGTTTAMAVLRALGESAPVSSSLPANPLDLKRSVVAEALAASDLAPGDCAGDPRRAFRLVGDPVLPVVAGLAAGAAERGARVTLAGGTQQVAALAALRHAGVTAPFEVATTSFVADDVPDLRRVVAGFDADPTVTDPGFAERSEPALARYVAGEAKEGAGMGGAVALAARAERLECLKNRIVEMLDKIGGRHEP
jgi:uncharacterized protein (TIGR00303 family)